MSPYNPREPEYKWKIKINLKTAWTVMQLSWYIFRELIRKKPKKKELVKRGFIIIAGTYREFTIWCKTSHKNPSDPRVVFANRKTHLLGWDYKTLKIIYVGNFTTNPLYQSKELAATEYIIKSVLEDKIKQTLLTRG